MDWWIFRSKRFRNTCWVSFLGKLGHQSCLRAATKCEPTMTAQASNIWGELCNLSSCISHASFHLLSASIPFHGLSPPIALPSCILSPVKLYSFILSPLILSPFTCLPSSCPLRGCLPSSCLCSFCLPSTCLRWFCVPSSCLPSPCLPTLCWFRVVPFILLPIILSSLILSSLYLVSPHLVSYHPLSYILSPLSSLCFPPFCLPPIPFCRILSPSHHLGCSTLSPVIFVSDQIVPPHLIPHQVFSNFLLFPMMSFPSTVDPASWLQLLSRIWSPILWSPTVLSPTVLSLIILAGLGLVPGLTRNHTTGAGGMPEPWNSCCCRVAKLQLLSLFPSLDVCAGGRLLPSGSPLFVVSLLVAFLTVWGLRWCNFRIWFGIPVGWAIDSWPWIWMFNKNWKPPMFSSIWRLDGSARYDSFGCEFWVFATGLFFLRLLCSHRGPPSNFWQTTCWWADLGCQNCTPKCGLWRKLVLNSA